MDLYCCRYSFLSKYFKDVEPEYEDSTSCQTSLPGGTSTDTPSDHTIPDLYSGCSVRKRKKEQRMDTSVYAKNLERAMNIIEEPEDEFQIFGNYIASLLRNVRNIEDARRAQRKVTMLALNCIDELDAGPSSRHIESSPLIATTPVRLRSSTPIAGLELETERQPVTPELYVSTTHRTESQPTAPELFVPPNYESEPQTLTSELLKFICDNNSNVCFVGEDGKCVDEPMSASELLKIISDNNNVRCIEENDEYTVADNLVQ